MSQLSILNDPQLEVDKQHKQSPVNKKNNGNGTKNSVSRYSGLKARLDQDIFNQNWIEVDTKKVKNKNSYNFVDLFAGAGGLSLGFVQAGYKKIFSSEIDKDAVSTLKRNFPSAHHFDVPIEELTENEIDKVVKNKKIHIVCGGPPCQGFSVAGLRNPHDPRNQLFREYIRVVKHLKPWFVVIENVPGIITMQNGEVYKEILSQLDALGYKNGTVRILEAATYGVPQLRTRAVFIANRFGLKNPYPKGIFEKGNYKSIDNAIDDLKNKKPDAATNHEWTWHSEKMIKRISNVPPGGSLYPTFRDAYKRQYKGVPSMTAKENHGGTHIHYEKNRVLSARELARLQSFPDDFIFSGTMKRAYWQIGNAVPVLLGKHIGLGLKDSLAEIEKKLT